MHDTTSPDFNSHFITYKTLDDEFNQIIRYQYLTDITDDYPEAILDPIDQTLYINNRPYTEPQDWVVQTGYTNQQSKDKAILHESETISAGMLRAMHNKAEQQPERHTLLYHLLPVEVLESPDEFAGWVVVAQRIRYPYPQLVTLNSTADELVEMAEHAEQPQKDTLLRHAKTIYDEVAAAQNN